MFKDSESDYLNHWIEDARRCIQNKTLDEQIAFILEHLDGSAKQEIMYRPLSVRQNPERIFEILVEVFEGTDSITDLHEAFSNRRQQADEHLLQYSIAIMKLWDRIERCGGAGSWLDRDSALSDRFASDVREVALQRELRSLKRKQKGLTFYQFRQYAIDFMGKDDKCTVELEKPAKSVSVKQSEVKSVVPNSSDRLADKMDKMLDVVQRLLPRNEQLDVSNSMANKQNSVSGEDSLSSRPSGQFNKNRRGGSSHNRGGANRSVVRCCYACQSPKHFIKDCPLIAQVQALKQSNSSSTEAPGNS